jgi:aspartyl-tRNA(Asn)/glutamyl-tRNA(Gln) amidotransferase subunit B
MELGGLRADVNVSVRQRGTSGSSSYSGVTGLGQRTEIKNLASLAAIEDAIVAEKDRQISVLGAGGVVEGETRGFALGATETTRLRGKEGEVDYRYMPDPDLPPLVIGSDLVEHLQSTLPELPDDTVVRVQQEYGLTSKDAKTLLALDDGARLEFMEETVDILCNKLNQAEDSKPKMGKLVGNWVLHEVGGLLTTSNTGWQDMSITEIELADILASLQHKHITSRAAKQLLATLHNLQSDERRPSVEQLIEDGNLRLRPLSDDEYTALAEEVMAQNPEMVAAVRDKGQKGKLMWFVGQMIRKGEEGSVEPEKAREVVDRALHK